MTGPLARPACPRHAAGLVISPRQLECVPVRRLPERNATSPRQRLKPTIGFATSLLAVWCQILLLATISLAPLTIDPDPLASVPICHTEDGTAPAQQEPLHGTHDCALCVLCLSHNSSLAILSLPPALPAHHSVAIVRRDAAQPRAPPV